MGLRSPRGVLSCLPVRCLQAFHKHSKFLEGIDHELTFVRAETRTLLVLGNMISSLGTASFPNHHLSVLFCVTAILKMELEEGEEC